MDDLLTRSRNNKTPPACRYPQAGANEPLMLNRGPIVVLHGGRRIPRTGTLSIPCRPDADLRLLMELDFKGWLQVSGDVELEVSGGRTTALLSSLVHENRMGVITHKAEAFVSTLETGSPEGFAALGFQVINFLDFIAWKAKGSPDIDLPLTSVCLRSKGWLVELAAATNANEVHKGLKLSGGYGFTHAGELRRDDGSTFSAADAETVLGALYYFLSWARGADCSLPLQWGSNSDGTVVWEKWLSQQVEPWTSSTGWFSRYNGQLLVELFPAFYDMSRDQDSGPVLRLALHWYLQCSTRAGGMEGAIILGLTALDLLGALILVDRERTMSSDDYDNLAAWKKLALLVDALKLPADVPAKYADLRAFGRANCWHGAATILAKIRHGFVHPKPANRKIVFSAPGEAILQAWWLALWYQELALLYLLNHRGAYRNRVTAVWVGDVEAVPWV